MYDIKIVGGNLYIDSHWSQQNLYLKDGKIALISPERLSAKTVYEAGGAHIVPGLIDSHVHLACPGDLSSADDFYTGSLAAITGGVTTMIDFLAESRLPEEVERAFAQRMADAKDCVIDYSFHCGLRQPENIPAIAKFCLEHGIPSFKLYTTYRREGIYSDDKHILEVLKRTSEHDMMALCHTENDSLIYPELTDLSAYSQRRPSVCEITEAIKLAEMTAYSGGLTYMVHVSSGRTITELKKRFADIVGQSFILESCPHYFIFDDSVYSGSDARLYTMTPPLRSPAEREELIRHIGDIQTLSTDHCPFLSAQKNVAIDDIPMGVGGLGYNFGQMHRLFGDTIIDRFTVNQAKIHGLYPQKGVIAEGSDADLTIFEPIAPTPCREIRGASDYSLYTGFNETIRIFTVLSRGEFVMKDGALCAEKGRGRYLRRTLGRS
jgi:dihydropyrimidinase